MIFNSFKNQLIQGAFCTDCNCERSRGGLSGSHNQGKLAYITIPNTGKSIRKLFTLIPCLKIFVAVWDFCYHHLQTAMFPGCIEVLRQIVQVP